jgi:arylsulfatase A-like enzyme
VHPDADQAAFVKMVERLDHDVGRVPAGIREMGLDADTLIVFMSDNGGQQAARSLPCSGREGQLLEGGIPMTPIFRQPGVVPAGRSSVTRRLRRTSRRPPWPPAPGHRPSGRSTAST